MPEQTNTAVRGPFLEAPLLHCYDRMKAALQNIAKQLTSEELARDHDHEGSPDYEGAYDTMINRALKREAFGTRHPFISVRR